MRLKNRIAIVTGAAGGIGEAITHLFAQHGAGVMAADLNSVGVSETSRYIADKGGLAHSIEVDVSDVKSVENLLEQTIKIFKP
jgi:NAD(P)-dependent dehydrogenase (short-subunit alcohol dehydrogenase family)